MIKWLQKVFEGKKRASAEQALYKEIDKQLVFAVSEPLTLGVEFELALLDAETLQPAHVGPDIIAGIGSSQIKEEGAQHMVEVTSTIGHATQEVEKQLREEFTKLFSICEKRNLLTTGTARPPTIKTADSQCMQNKRMNRLADERKIFNSRFDALGMHIHLGMKDAEQCVRYNNFFMHFLPHLIALSASSPFEDGIYTGLASIRPSIAESMPIAGVPYYFNGWQDYVRLCHALFRAGSIQKLKDLWWDIRPSPNFGTLEIRVCDQPATLDEGMAITAFVHLLALWFQEHQSWLDEMPRPNAWRLRENKWRAMRYGLDAQLVIDNQGETRPLCDDINLWIERLSPFTEQLGYKKYTDMLVTVMTRGNSAKRQQRLWDATQNLEAVAKFNCAEFTAQTPLWDKLEADINEITSKNDAEKAVAS
ncbi:MAG: YbdK family carboxylate-amine ligase [Bdellovibrionales bacterium]